MGMDLNIHESLEPSSFKYNCDDDGNNNDHVEPQELLEECWFFRNLLDRKTRIVRSFSDPCTSSNFSQENLPAKSYHQMYESIEKQPSMPPCLERKLDQENPITKGTICTEVPPINKSNRKITFSNNLLRAPSLPNSFGIQEVQEEEDNEFSMGKLIRQASMNSSERKNAAKCVTKSLCSISRNRSRMKPEPKGKKLEGLEETRNQSLMNQFKIQSNLKNIEVPEEYLQGFKDLGFNFDKKDTNDPNEIATINEGLQEKFKEDEEKNSPTEVPTWDGIGKKKSTEDLKEQIKFWAKAVASNVR